MYSFIHQFHQSIHPFIQAIIHPFDPIHSPIPFNPSIHVFIHSSIYPIHPIQFIHPFHLIHPNYPSIHVFIRSLIHPSIQSIHPTLPSIPSNQCWKIEWALYIASGCKRVWERRRVTDRSPVCAHFWSWRNISEVFINTLNLIHHSYYSNSSFTKTRTADAPHKRIKNVQLLKR